MTDLSEKSLEDAIVQIKRWTEDGKSLLALKPTKMFVPKYPDETYEEYTVRVEQLRALEKQLREKI